MADAASANLAPTLPPGLPADWVFDRDLPCPKCRYNLRMLRLPRCPECGGVFRWQSLLQIVCPRCGERLAEVDGEQCPRCGLGLNWERLLAEADPERRKLFEYTNRPVRGALRTWVATLRPRRFWKSIPLELPPAVRRLRWLRRVAFGVCLAAFGVAIASRVPTTPPAFVEWLPVLGLVFVLPALTMLGLPRFTPTLARFRIRRDQLLRCFAYASTGLLWIGVVFLLAVGIALLVNTFWPITFVRGGIGFFQESRMHIDLTLALDALSRPRRFFRPGVAASMWCNSLLSLVMLYFAFAWWRAFLWTALRSYLRLDRSNALALFLSTQLIGLIAIGIVLIRNQNTGAMIGHLLNRFF
jgi:hypothetical protein